MTPVRELLASSEFESYTEDPAVLAFHARTRRRVTRPCACTGRVTANPIDPTPGVREHQQTPEHRAWRERMGL